MSICTYCKKELRAICCSDKERNNFCSNECLMRYDIEGNLTENILKHLKNDLNRINLELEANKIILQEKQLTQKTLHQEKERIHRMISDIRLWEKY